MSVASPCCPPAAHLLPTGYLNLHGELPGLVGHLRTHLQRIITRRLVEPHRRYLDLQRIYRNKHLQRVGREGRSSARVDAGAA